jgi:hypothetical protein
MLVNVTSTAAVAADDGDEVEEEEEEVNRPKFLFVRSLVD